MNHPARCKTAFTLIEILVVLGIIGLLLALILPAVSRVRQQARVTQCANRLHQVGVALQAHQTARGCLPSDGKNGYGYGVYLLPQLERANLFEKVNPHGASFSNAGPGQLDAGKTRVQVYLCSHFDKEWELESSGFARSNYVGNAALLDQGIDLSNVMDGESNTIAAGETIEERSWIEPNTATLSSVPNAGTFASRHTAGANFVMCDGSVQFIAETIDPATFQALGTPRGKDLVGEF